VRERLKFERGIFIRVMVAHHPNEHATRELEATSHADKRMDSVRDGAGQERAMVRREAALG